MLAVQLEEGSWGYVFRDDMMNVYEGGELELPYDTADEAIQTAALLLDIDITDCEISEEFGHEAAVIYFE